MPSNERLSRKHLLSGVATAALIMGSVGFAHATDATTNVNVVGPTGYSTTGNATSLVSQNNFNFATPSTQGWTAYSPNFNASVTTTVTQTGNLYSISVGASGSVYGGWTALSGFTGSPSYTISYNDLTPSQVSALANYYQAGASGPVTVSQGANSLTITLLPGGSVSNLPFAPLGVGSFTQTQNNATPNSGNYGFGSSSGIIGATTPLTINSGITSASVVNGNITSPGFTTGAPSSQSVSTNIISSSALGNTATVDPTTVSQSSLATLGGTNTGTQNGVSSLVAQTNVGSGQAGGNVVVESAVTNSTQAATTAGPLAGSAISSAGNTMSASTTLNNSTTTLSGSIPVTYTGAGVAVGGSSVLTSQNQIFSGTTAPSGSGSVAASGNIVATTTQLNALTGATGTVPAYVAHNGNTLNVTTNGTGTFDATSIQAVTNANAITATFTGNAANTGISIAAGGANALSGSAVVTNVQENTNVAAQTNASAYQNQIVTNFAGSSNLNDVRAVNSTVTTTANTISATATGNQAVGTAGAAGNTISLAPSVDLAGVTLAQNNQATVYASNAVSADLAIGSTQSASVSVPIAATSDNNTINQSVQEASGSTLNLANNAVSATATSNAVSNAIAAGTGGSAITTPTIAGLIAIGNMQTVDNVSPVTATAANNTIDLQVGNGPAPGYTVVNNTITATANSIAAAATGNTASNAVSIAADVVALGATGGTPALGTFSSTQGGDGITGYPSSLVYAGASANNVQYTGVSDVTANNTGNRISITAAAAGSNLDTNLITLQGGSAPALQAVAETNVANNSVTVNATSLTGSAGISDAQSMVYGATAANLTNGVVSITAGASGNQVTNDTIALGSALNGTTPIGTGGNTLRALAYNNQGTDAVSITSTTALLPATGGTAVHVPGQNTNNPTVNAAYGSLAAQSSSGPSTATASFNTIPLMLTLQNSGSTDTLSNASNVIASAAYGNQETNSAALTTTSLSQDLSTYAPVISATTAQWMNSAAVDASITGPGATTVSTSGVYNWTAPSALFASMVDAGSGYLSGYSLTNSTDAVSSNTAIAQAQVNTASTTTTVMGGNIVDPGAGTLSARFPQGSDAGTADAAMTAVNAQVSLTAPVTAIQTETGAYAAVNGGVIGSTILAETNRFAANATNNSGTTPLSAGSTGSPVTLLNATGGLINSQLVQDGSTTATLGAPGTPGTPATPGYTGGSFYVASSGLSSGTWSGNTLSVSGATATLNFASSADAAAFVANISSGSVSYTAGSSVVTVNAGTTLTLANALGSVQNWSYGIAGNNTTQQGVFSLPGTSATPGTPTYPSVQIFVAGTQITNATLTTASNAMSASATANSGVNTLAVNANTLASGGVTGQANSFTNGELDGANAAGTNTLLNQQMVYGYGAGGPTRATGYGLFTVTNTAANPVITGSALSVANNGVSVSGTANTATNKIAIAANTVGGATAALVSNQGQATSVYAQSGAVSGNTVTNYGMIATAPAAITDSSVSLTGNTNTVTASGNIAKNTVSEVGVSLNSAAPTIQATTTPRYHAISDGAMQNASADLVLGSAQTSLSGESIGATATSLVTNNDPGATTSGLVTSTATLSNNATAASSIANTGVNALTIAATSVDQSAALSTSQQSYGNGVTATANQDVALNLIGGATGTTPAASQSTILLQGNSTSALAQNDVATNTLNVSANTATFGSTVDANATNGQATAAYALGNQQSSDAVLTASAVGNTSVSDALAYPAISASSITLSGNAVNATAQGNLANSGLTIAADVTTGSVGVTGSVASNQTVSAAVDATSTSTLSAPGRLDNSQVSISSNTAGSLASGNTASNALTVTTAALTNVTGSAAVADAIGATATFTVGNLQDNTAPISATTTALIQNSDIGATATSGLTSSTALFNSNSATAQANGNVAANALTLNALNSTATGALSNVQTGTNTSTATVGQTVTFSLPGAVANPAASDAKLQLVGNAAQASATVNSATNTVNVSATGVTTAVSGQAVADGANTTSTATYSLASSQTANTDATASATNHVSVVDSVSYPAIMASTISVDSNSLVSAAQLNNATNALTVAVTDSQNGANNAATAALTNVQTASGIVTADAGTATVTAGVANVGTYGLLVAAPGRLDSSTMSISNNTNTAQAIGNNATSTLSVSGSNIAGNTSLAAVVNGSLNLTQAQSATATYAVQNTQTVGGTVDATATTNGYNRDYYGVISSSSSGLNNSAVAINGNVTQALGFANNATNQLSLSATNLGAPAAVGNVQTSTSDVTSVALGVFNYGMAGSGNVNPSGSVTGAPNAAVTGSTVAMTGNSVQSQAVGNAASNALNATATATYGTAQAASNTSNTGVNAPTYTSSTTASFAVLNDQTNNGAVTALARGTYQVALNGGASGSNYGGNGATNSTIGVTGNVVKAAAFGNTATSSITLASLNSGNTTAALGNQQLNIGNVTASANNSAIGITATGGAGSFVGGAGLLGSTAVVSGNSITAHAVGNSMISSITAR